MSGHSKKHTDWLYQQKKNVNIRTFAKLVQNHFEMDRTDMGAHTQQDTNTHQHSCSINSLPFYWKQELWLTITLQITLISETG